MGSRKVGGAQGWLGGASQIDFGPFPNHSCMTSLTLFNNVIASLSLSPFCFSAHSTFHRAISSFVRFCQRIYGQSERKGAKTQRKKEEMRAREREGERRYSTYTHIYFVGGSVSLFSPRMLQCYGGRGCRGGRVSLALPNSHTHTLTRIGIASIVHLCGCLAAELISRILEPFDLTHSGSRIGFPHLNSIFFIKTGAFFHLKLGQFYN